MTQAGYQLTPVSGGMPVPPTDAQFGSYNHPHFSEPESEFDIIAILSRILRYRWLIALAVVCGLATGVMYTWLQTPIYTATAKLELITNSAKVVEELQIISESGDIRAFQTAVEKLKSRALAERVVFALDLSNNEAFLFPAPSFSISNLLRRVLGGAPDRPDLSDFSPEQRQAIGIARVQGGLSVGLLRNTNILAISFSHPEVRFVHEVANQLANSFMDQRVDQTSETSDLARQFIRDQVELVKKNLQASEEALVDYAKSVGITVSGDEISLIGSNMNAINAALSKAIENRLILRNQVEQIEKGEAASLPRMIDSAGIGRMRESLASLQAEYQQKRATFQPGFPEMVKLNNQIKEVSRQINSAVQSLAEAIRIEYQQAISRENDLRKQLALLEEQQSEYQDKRIRYSILKREVDSNRSQYDSLIGKLNEVGVGAELKDAKAAMVDPAVRPGAPSSPRLRNGVMGALMLALLLVGAAIYIIELLNNTFTTPDQLEEELRLPVLGILPKVEEKELSQQLADGTSGISEAYRSLRTALQFVGTSGMPQTITITSAEASEGKSTTALRLAEDCAKLGGNVLLIDCDMRRPNMHRLIDTSNSVGLSNLLTSTISEGDARKVFKRSTTPNLSVVTSGPIPPNPADLLSSSKMSMILAKFSERFDLIVIDAPPVIGLADAPIIARHADATVLMVAANATSRKSAQSAVKRLQSTGGHVVGTVLSKFSVNRFDYSYQYRYMKAGYYNYGSDQPELLTEKQQEAS